MKKRYKVTYNDTDMFLVFRDRYFDTLAGANRFYDKMKEICGGKVKITDTHNDETVRDVE